MARTTMEVFKRRAAQRWLAVWVGVGLNVAFAQTAHADSFVSSASGAGSASVGSVSDSFRGSSDSSQNSSKRDSDDKRFADADYRIVEVEAADRPGYLRLILARAAPAVPAANGEAELPWSLQVPQAVGERAGLARGDLIRARERPYGVAFARADANEPFYLVLADDWRRGLATKVVEF